MGFVKSSNKVQTIMKYKESDIVWVEISSTIRGPYFGPVKLEKEDGKEASHVIPGGCKGCGVCVATCPSAAINASHFGDDVIFSQVRAALEVKA